MTEDLLYFNGINGATGEYLLPPLPPKQISKIARGEQFDQLELIELQQRWESDSNQPSGLVEGKDPKNLAEAGWGVIFAYEYKNSNYTAEDLKNALSELLEHRCKQASKDKEHYYREFIGSKAYRTGESKQKFLERHRVGPGPANPEKMPYYLLIVGDPESIPYRFQYQLDVQYAVGRIYFDTLEEYAQYAHSIVEAETGQLALPRNISLFGVHNSDDRATQLSADRLIKPLSELVSQDNPDWSVQTILREEATKSRLSQLIGGADTPAVLFTASHGVSFPKDHPRQFPHQGALICQDWPGPIQWKGELDADNHYFCADDVSDDAKLLGLIAFHFACYGAGTPQTDDFFRQTGIERQDIAPHAFVAKLPQKLLSHPKGGALAVIGHVERAWGCSFMWKRAGEQLDVFQCTLKRLMEGHPIGSAIEFFNERYAELSSDLSSELGEIKHSTPANDWDLANIWTANNDARNYAIVGDPAVRLMVADPSTPSNQRPTVEKPVLFTPKTIPSNPVELGQTSANYSQQEDWKDIPESFKQMIEELVTRVERLERQVKTLQDQNQFLQQQINNL
jgi:hypothetical protein